jgi:hypothetical protein
VNSVTYHASFHAPKYVDPPGFVNGDVVVNCSLWGCALTHLGVHKQMRTRYTSRRRNTIARDKRFLIQEPLLEHLYVEHLST